MSWSLQLRSGDLVVSGAHISQAAGISKLVQDLRCALLEPRGFDDLHPTYGSLIDGGIDEYGNYAASLIGSVDLELVALRVDSEIRRITSEHQLQQTNRASNDRIIYGESTLTNDELLRQVTNIQMTQAQDQLMVIVTLQTAPGQNITIPIPVSISV